MDLDVHISPEPTPDDRQAILTAVAAMLRREAELARPSAWRLAGRIDLRVGITDLAGALASHRVWPLSARTPGGGRIFPGLNGRGDAK